MEAVREGIHPDSITEYACLKVGAVRFSRSWQLIYKSVLNYQTSPFFMMADRREGVHMKGKTWDLFLV